MNSNPTIRIASPADAGEILKIYKPHVLSTATTFEETVPSIEEFQQRISTILEECPCLVCEIDGAVVGYAYASSHRSRAAYRWNKEVSVYVAEQFQQKRVARALYTSLFAILKEQGICNLLAGITLPNEASVGFHESMGFEKCAEFRYIGFKLGKWHTVGWWELFLLGDEKSTPMEPIPFSQFKKQTSMNPLLLKGVPLLKH